VESVSEPRRAQKARWYQRVLPVTGLLIVLVAAAVVAVPGFRHQLALSTSRQPQHYIELYFANTHAGGQQVCRATRSSVLVRFAVVSHLEHGRRLSYRVTVAPLGKRGPVRRVAGHGVLKPGTTAVVARRLPRPGRGYAVTVRVRQLHRHLYARCGSGHR
jgi:hypothetical protein